MVDMFLLVIQKAITNIELEVTNIILKENKFVDHLKNLYNIIFLEDMNKFVSIDKVMEYKVKLIFFFFMYIQCNTNYCFKYQMLKMTIFLLCFI